MKNAANAKNSKGVKEKKRQLNPKSIFRFYKVLFYTGTVIVCNIAFFLAIPLGKTYPYLPYIPVYLWMTTGSIIFFSSVRIVYLQTTHGDRLLAKKAIGYWEDFRTICIASGVLLVVNIILYLNFISFIDTIIPILAGWIISRILRFVRLRYYKG